MSHVHALWVATRPPYYTGSVVSADATHVYLAQDASDVDDYYNGMVIKIIGGTGNGQSRTISDYVGLLLGATYHYATISVAWTTVPDMTSIYEFVSIPYALTDSDYQVYSLGSQNENPKVRYTYYDMGSTNAQAVQSFGISPIPTIDDLPIKIRYRSYNIAYSVMDMNAMPDIDPRWHNALSYFIVYMVASAGPIPDASIANFWSTRYEESIQSYKMTQIRKEQVAPKRRRDNAQWAVRLY